MEEKVVYFIICYHSPLMILHKHVLCKCFLEAAISISPKWNLAKYPHRCHRKT